jgi:acylphosphatase
MSQKLCKRIVVTGIVQGVAFRYYTRSAARKIGVVGWVRNLPDGNVEALVEGEPDQVDAMVRWLHKGSPASRVDKVSIFEEKATGRHAEFDITYVEGGAWW